MPRIDVDGLTIAYERVGTGPPVALLHGYVGDGPSLWRPQLDALSDVYTVVAWDAPPTAVARSLGKEASR
jgi:pimeloyl-ACP methyl ester carboxylesterase